MDTALQNQIALQPTSLYQSFSDTQASSCAAEVMRLPAANKDGAAASPGFIGVVIASAASACMSEIRGSLQSGSLILSDLLRCVERSRRRESHNQSSLVELLYRERTVVACTFSNSSGISAAVAPFAGGLVSDRHFQVTRHARHQYSPAVDVLVVIQQPRLSTLEHELTGLVPVGLAMLNQSIDVGFRNPLLVMDQGWAVGGLLARVAVSSLQRKWKQEEAGCSGALSEPDTGARLVCADDRFDLSWPAEILLEKHSDAIRQKLE